MTLWELWALAVSSITLTWDRRKNADSMVQSLPPRYKSSPPYSADRFHGTRVGLFALHPYVPQELAEIIISHLVGDSRTLRNCSLVCKSWTHPSRIHLFKNVVLNFASPVQVQPELGQYPDAFISITRTFTTLLNHLDNFPHLAWYISYLEIRNYWCVNPTSRVSKEALRIIAHLLPKLRHITRFIIRNSHLALLSDNEVRGPINALLALPTLRHIVFDKLTIVTFKDLSDLLGFTPHLSTLVLNDITCLRSHTVGDESRDHWNTTMSAQSVDLCELRVDSPGLSPHLDWLCSSQSPFNVGNIQNLYLSARGFSQQTVSNLLLNNVTTLRRLELGATLTNDVGRSHINLGMMANIRILTLQLVNIDALPASAFFCSLDPSRIHPLEEATFRLLSPALIWRDWSELDTSLTQPGLARLRYVQVQVPAGIWQWTNPNLNFEKFKAQFPALEKKGILRILTD